MATLKIEGSDQLRELAAKLKTADPKIRRELVKSLRPSVKKITGEIQETVRSAPSEGHKGLGHERRAAHTLARTKGLSTKAAVARASKKLGPNQGLGEFDRLVEAEREAHRAKQVKKAEEAAGLRESIASATAGSISTGSKATGVSVTWKVRAAKLANRQRRLPRDFNRARGWRHPVFGDRENWVSQQGLPYFDDVIKRHNGDLEKQVVEGLTRAAEAILHPET
jgi:hypothetical protein